LNVPGKNKEQDIYIGLGSNINPEKNLPQALIMLSQAVKLKSHSSAWESQPAGTDIGPNFINAVALITTDIPVNEFRNQVLRQIESQLGRLRTSNQNAPRTIDLDIIMVNQQILDPQIWEQVYLAVPLVEIGVCMINPRGKKTLSQTAHQLAKQRFIQKRPDIFAKMDLVNKNLET
jgi:2-amino-4-hydroxy-6-hydroxymethyldihydropteridine diphosphokinase